MNNDYNQDREASACLKNSEKYEDTPDANAVPLSVFLAYRP